MAIFLKGQMMKLKWIAIAGLVLLAAQAYAEVPKTLTTDTDRLSYAIGVETARTVAKGGVDIDQELLIQGLKDGFGRGALLAPEPELRKVMNAFRGQMYAKAAQSRRAVTEGNKRNGAFFLAENKLKQGVETLANGLEYKVVKAGKGKPPIDSDTIEFHYRGTLLDGGEFAGTGSDKPLRQTVNVVMPAGLKEAVKQMTVGAKWQVWVPSALGYGERGVGEDIGPNEVLVYDVELVSIAK